MIFLYYKKLFLDINSIFSIARNFSFYIVIPPMHDCYSGLLMDIYYSTSPSITLFFNCCFVSHLTWIYWGIYAHFFLSLSAPTEPMMMAVHCVGNFAAVVLLFLWFPVRLWAEDKNMEIFRRRACYGVLQRFHFLHSHCTSFPHPLSQSHFFLTLHFVVILIQFFITICMRKWLSENFFFLSFKALINSTTMMTMLIETCCHRVEMKIKFWKEQKF